MKRLGTLWGTIAITALACIANGGPATAAPSPFTYPLGCGVGPNDFRITRVATGLNWPYGVQVLADGSLLVAVSVPNSPTSGYFATTGQLMRFVDANADGVADGPPAILFNGLPGALTDVRVAGPLVFVTSAKSGAERISVLRMGATPADPLSLVGSLNFVFPSNWEHKSYGLAVRPVPAAPGTFDLFFNIGSQANDATTPDTATVTASANGGLVYVDATGTLYQNGATVPDVLHGDSIYRMTVVDVGTGVQLSQLTRIASGLRNAAGMVVRERGDANDGLYFEDNGIDGLTDPTISLSADELNFIALADIGVATDYFGFAENYTDYATGTFVGGQGIPPLLAYLPIIDYATGTTSDRAGGTDVAVAPTGFPAGVNTGMFVGFHGNFAAAGVSNVKNPFTYYDVSTGRYCDFISNAEPNVGHLDGQAATDASLFIVDMTSQGSTDAPGAGTGVLYQVKVSEPVTLSIAFAGTGVGTVSITPPATTCSAPCVSTYMDALQTIVTLKATAGPNSVLDGWGGDPDCVDASVTMSTSRQCTVSFRGLPDLTETTISNPPASAKAGAAFAVTDTAANQGLVSSTPSTTRYYLSLDAVRDSRDILLSGSRAVPALQPGASSAGTVTVTIPRSAKPGTYFVLACADDLGVVTEGNETNNCVASATSVTVKRN